MKGVAYKCVICAKLNANRILKLIQGNLPTGRTNQALPFRGTVGLDMAGPFSVKLPGRRTRSTSQPYAKGYLLLFICFSTRAVHLEFMSDMSTPALLAAWDRMVSRRGTPKKCLSDHGSNFVGARRLNCEYSQFLETNKETIISTLASRSIEWELIPVATPHMGGIYERAIGSAKRILKGLVGDNPLLFEEYCTIFAKVECLLNSGPYWPLTCNPEDSLSFVTPGHFLIQSTFDPLPEPEPDSKPLSRRFDNLRMITQNFWKKWSLEYLNTLQPRQKWASPTENIREGQIVLIKDNRYAPAAWPLGIVTRIYPGSLKSVRVVDVRTNGVTVQRAVTNLRIIPVPLSQN